jgi:hypothetical protein
VWSVASYVVFEWCLGGAACVGPGVRIGRRIPHHLARNFSGIFAHYIVLAVGVVITAR